MIYGMESEVNGLDENNVTSTSGDLQATDVTNK
jgi:hypothetical protein